MTKNGPNGKRYDALNSYIAAYDRVDQLLPIFGFRKFLPLVMLPTFSDTHTKNYSLSHRHTVK